MTLDLAYTMIGRHIPLVILLPLLLVLSLTLLAQAPSRIVRLTVFNKSHYELFIELKGQAQKGFYYLRVNGSEGNETTIRVYTVLADRYTVRAWYVYNNLRQCSGDSTLNAMHNVRMIFPECNITVPLGDQYVRKYLMKAYIY